MSNVIIPQLYLHSSMDRFEVRKYAKLVFDDRNLHSSMDRFEEYV